MTSGISLSLKELIQLQGFGKSLSLASNNRTRAVLHGNHMTKLRGRGIDFEKVRAYQAGDDIRSMDWRVTARTGKPHIKLYREERERPVYIVVDLTPSMFFGTKVAFKSWVASQAAALLGWSAVHHGDKLGGIVVFSEEEQIQCPARTRQHGILPFLKHLADQQTPHAENIEPQALSIALSHLKHVAKPGSLIILISDFQPLSADIDNHLCTLRQHTQLLALAINDPTESTLPPPGRYSISDGQTIMSMNTQSVKFCQAYEQQFKNSRAQLLSMLQSARIPLIELSTTDNVYKTLYQTLRKG